MRVPRKPIMCPPHHIDNLSLQSVSCYKYLGVCVTDNLSWKTRVDFTVDNANRMLGHLRRNVSLACTNFKFFLYKNLVYAKLEYAAFIWDPCQNNNVSTVECVQNRFNRFILSIIDPQA